MIDESHLLPTLPAVSTGVFHPARQPGRVVAPAGDEGSRVADCLGLGDYTIHAVVDLAWITRAIVGYGW